MSDAHIRASNLVFSWPDGTPVLDGLSFVIGRARTGLVAPNGGGKSTLLRLMAGELKPASGVIDTRGRVAYLPQGMVPDMQSSVAAVLGVESRLAALDAIAEGRGEPQDFERAEGEWDLRERIAATLERLGLPHLSLDRRIASLSGGEAMSLVLAQALLQRPDILLLDEPTNHLDATRRRQLRDVLANFDGCVVVASHDRTLLREMDQIARLRPDALDVFGGGLDAFESMAETERVAAEQRVRHLRDTVERDKRSRQEAHERAERRAGNARKNLANAGLPRIVAGNRERSAQASAGKARHLHESRVEDASTRLRVAARALHETDPVDFSLPDTRVAADQLLFHARDLRVERGGRSLFGPRGVALDIRGPERIALTGANGVGKTTLLKIIAGALVPGDGIVGKRAERVAYLSQGLEGLDASASALDNLGDAIPDMALQERADLLARLQLRGDRMLLPVGSLSGGERVRVMLACVLHAMPAPQLLLLDEPTNHLDMEAVRQLQHALAAYEGAMVVVSHDESFVEALMPTRRLALASDGWHELAGAGTATE